MRIYLFIRRIVIFTSLVLICGLPALATQAADQPSGGSPPVVLTGEPATMAAGAVEDTHKACLARIPTDGSAGQRMLATQNCKQDEETRKASQDAPKFWAEFSTPHTTADGLLEGLTADTVRKAVSTWLPMKPSKVSARNKVSGRVTDIRKGPALASVSVDGGELKFTTAITSLAVEDLQLKQGDQVTIIFKATEVMLQKALMRTA